MKTYVFDIKVGSIEVEANSPKEALALAQNQLEELAGSNDGSNMLGNADLTLRDEYDKVGG